MDIATAPITMHANPSLLANDIQCVRVCVRVAVGVKKNWERLRENSYGVDKRTTAKIYEFCSVTRKVGRGTFCVVLCRLFELYTARHACTIRGTKLSLFNAHNPSSYFLRNSGGGTELFFAVIKYTIAFNSCKIYITNNSDSLKIIYVRNKTTKAL